jgi:trimethylamine:corrinoid methyltransferase-like protein
LATPANNDFLQIAQKKWKAVLNAYQAPELPESINKDLQRYINKV